MDSTPSISVRLEQVRAKLEDRFMRVGSTMALALEGVEALIKAIERLHSALGEDTAAANLALRAAAGELLGLPPIQADRRIAFEALVLQSRKLAINVDQMHTLLRYLRAFAMTLKVTAASAPTFDGFAQELIDRIALGAEKLVQFSARQADLDAQLTRALDLARALDGDCDRLLPSVAANLEASASALHHHNEEISGIALEVSALSQQIRMKVCNALIALQIGDNTRQRIEHVQFGLSLLDQAGGADDTGARSAGAIGRLLQLQLTDLTEVFATEAQRVSQNLSGLMEDANEILRLKTALGEGHNAAFLRHLASDVGDADTVIGRVSVVNQEAAQSGRTAISIAETLIANVDVIQSVKTEIRFMALNTNVRCAQMGPSGQPVAVIGSELSGGAARLGQAADATIEELDGLAQGAQVFADAKGDGDLGGEFNRALRDIRNAGNAAELSLEDIERLSREVAKAIAELGAVEDFHSDLCSDLDATRDALDRETQPDLNVACITNTNISATLDRLFKSYTMGREREIHLGFTSSEGIALPVANETEGAASVEDDEDGLFAGALF